MRTTYLVCGDYLFSAFTLRLQSNREFVEFLLRLFLFVAISFLDAADQLISLSSDHGQLVVGQLAPLLLDLAGQLLPIAFDLIPVHGHDSVKKRLHS